MHLASANLFKFKFRLLATNGIGIKITSFLYILYLICMQTVYSKISEKYSLTIPTSWEISPWLSNHDDLQSHSSTRPDLVILELRYFGNISAWLANNNNNGSDWELGAGSHLTKYSEYKFSGSECWLIKLIWWGENQQSWILGISDKLAISVIISLVIWPILEILDLMRSLDLILLHSSIMICLESGKSLSHLVWLDSRLYCWDGCSLSINTINSPTSLPSLHPHHQISSQSPYEVTRPGAGPGGHKRYGGSDVTNTRTSSGLV